MRQFESGVGEYRLHRRPGVLPGDLGEHALTAIEGAELDLGVSTLIRVPVIKNAHKRKKIVYRVYMTDGDPAKFLSAGGSQRVRPIDEATLAPPAGDGS